jgi:hypothetical protein
MDDLFSILIYIIVIISFLASLFKKKSPGAPPTQDRRVPQDRLPDETVAVEEPGQKEPTDYDILKEIENMFKTDAERHQELSGKTKIQEVAQKTEKKHPVSYEDYVQKQSAEVSPYDKFNEQRVSQSERRYSDYKSKQVKVDSKVEEQARKFQALLERRKSAQEVPANRIIRKIRNPETIREYILVSEILARPKALRR